VIIWSASTPNNTSPNPSSRNTNCSAGETVVEVELVELVVVLSGATEVVIGANVVSGVVVAVVGIIITMIITIITMIMITAIFAQSKHQQKIIP
jgi:hypothetical protein